MYFSVLIIKSLLTAASSDRSRSSFSLSRKAYDTTAQPLSEIKTHKKYRRERNLNSSCRTLFLNLSLFTTKKTHIKNVKMEIAWKNVDFLRLALNEKIALRESRRDARELKSFTFRKGTTSKPRSLLNTPKRFSSHSKNHRKINKSTRWRDGAGWWSPWSQWLGDHIDFWSLNKTSKACNL